RLNNLSPICSASMSPPATNNSSSIIMNSPSDSFTSDYSSSANQIRPPLSTITPTKNNLTTYTEKTKPRPLTKRMGFKRAV
ncbi:unnamed protein product, partial [Rotaria magnacalcarata]